MNLQTVVDRSVEEERAASARIAAAAKLLRGAKSDVPDDFAKLLFGHADAEDLIVYDAAELAALASGAWAFLSARKPNLPKIRIEHPQASDSKASGGGSLKSVSVVEIVNDDMPFLVDSVMGELTERGMTARLIVHPILQVERDKSGKLTAPPKDAGNNKDVRRESFIHIHVARIDDAARRADVVQALEQTLAQVRAAVKDWRPMLGRIGDVIAELKTNPPPVPVDDIAEAIQFLEWLAADNFTFFGVREYAFKSGDLVPVKDSGLGILRDGEIPVFTRGREPQAISPETRAFFDEPKTLIVLKANVRSRIHRRVHLDYVGVKRFDADGNPTGEFRILGLFTSTAYTRSTRTIPYLRRKVDAVLRRAGFDPGGHSGKALVNVLEGYPRDELFQIDEDTLYEFANAIMQLDERPRVRVLSRLDRFDRFVSVLVYVPRERYNSYVRSGIGAYLAQAYGGEVAAFYPFFPEGPLTRVHFIIRRVSGEPPRPDRAELERNVGAIVRTWSDDFADALAAAQPEQAGTLLERYREAFSPGYRDTYSPAIAVADIPDIEALSTERPIGVDFFARNEDNRPCVGLQVWSHGRPIPLSERVPVLENMGFRVVDERTFEIGGQGNPHVDAWLHDMVLERADGAAGDLDKLKAALEAAFVAVMRGEEEKDG